MTDRMRQQQSSFTYNPEYQTLIKINHGTKSTIALSQDDIETLYLYLLSILQYKLLKEREL